MNKYLFFILFLSSFANYSFAQCPTIESILIDACGDEGANEFILLNTGGGFNTSDLQIDFAPGNNTGGNVNKDINIGPNPCSFVPGDASLIDNCSDVISVGLGVDLPANSILIIQTGNAANTHYDFSALCGTVQCVYVIKNSCDRIIGGFTNGGSGTRTTHILLSDGSGCDNAYTYDRSQLSGTDGDYYAPSLGTYGNDGCVSTPISPPPTISIDDQTICASDNPFDLTSLEPAGQTGGVWSLGGVDVADATAEVVGNGSTYTYAYGCSSSDDVTFTVTDPSMDVSGGGTICVNDCLNNAFTFTVQNGTPPFSVAVHVSDGASTLDQTITLNNTPESINVCSQGNAVSYDSGTNTLTVPNFIVGTWTVTISDFMNHLGFPDACLGTATGNPSITINPPPVITIGNQTICASDNPFDLTSLEPATQTGGSWSQSGIAVADATNETVSDGSVYTYSWTDGSGCTGTTDVTFTVNPNPIVDAGSYNNPNCTTDGMITLVGSPTGGQFTYLSNPITVFDPSIGQGDYVIEYVFQDVLGCVGQDTALIVVENCDCNLDLAPDAGPDQIICEADLPVQLNGSVGTDAGAYFWSGGLGGTFDDVNDLNTTYNPSPSEIGTTIMLTLTVMDPDNAGPCTDEVDDVFISIVKTPINTNLTATTCDPQQVGIDTLTLQNQTGCDSLVITTTTLSPTDVTNLIAVSCNPNQVGVDTLIYTNLSGCDSLVITTTTYDANGIDVTNLSATTCDSLQVGIDTLIYSNQSGCDSLVITTRTYEPVSITQNLAYTCDSTQVGIDTLVLINQNGCDSMVITTTVWDINSIPVIAIDNQIICASENPFDLTGLEPTGQGGGVWTLNNVVIPNPNQFDAMDGDTLVYRLDVGGCVGTDEVVFTVKPNPIVHAGTYDNPYCTTDSAFALVGTPSGGIFYYNNLPVTEFDPMAVDTGTYIITYKITVNGCPGQDTAQLVVKTCDCQNIPTAFAGNDTVLCEQTQMVIQLNGEIGGDASSVLWTGQGVFSDSTSLNPTYIPTADEIHNGHFTLTLTTNDPDGPGTCVAASSSVNIEITHLDVDLQSLTDFYGYDIPCPGGMDGSVQAFVEGGTQPYDFEWNAGEAKPIHSDLAAGEYRVTVTDAIGCIGSSDITLTEPEAINADLEVIDEGCDGSEGGLFIHGIDGGVQPFTLYLDSVPYAILQAPPYTHHSLLGRGAHELTIGDANGCVDTIGFEIQEGSDINIDLGPDIFIKQGDEVTIALDAGNHVLSDIEWFVDTLIDCHNCPDITIHPLYTVRVWSEVLDDKGCAGADEMMVFVERLGLYVPNIFSPNGDGKNDLLQLFVSSQVAKINQFVLYDRWGNEIVGHYDITPSGQPLIIWDGVFRGEEMSPQVFVYHLRVTYKDGVVEELSGDITLVR